MMESPQRHIAVEWLTPQAFAQFGDVIEAGNAARQYTINEGFATRYHDLAHIDVTDKGGRATVNIFRALPRAIPMQLRVMERHPLGSQAFMPLDQRAYLVVVAPASATLLPDQIRCFLAEPGQGVNYAKGTWHHPLIAMDATADFLVVDRGSDTHDHNLDEVSVLEHNLWIDHIG
jgi:ureidoglycolate lyase